MTIHVTETQRFIARAALVATGADERLRDPALVEDLIRAMLVIEEGRMQPYMLRGFNWSCYSRNPHEPLTVSRDREVLGLAVERFHQYIDEARGAAARRIRGNRARRFKQLVQEAQQLQEFAGERMRNLQMRRRAVFLRDAANWDEEPRHRADVGAG